MSHYSSSGPTKDIFENKSNAAQQPTRSDQQSNWYNKRSSESQWRDRSRYSPMNNKFYNKASNERKRYRSPPPPQPYREKNNFKSKNRSNNFHCGKQSGNNQSNQYYTHGNSVITENGKNQLNHTVNNINNRNNNVLDKKNETYNSPLHGSNNKSHNNEIHKTLDSKPIQPILKSGIQTAVNQTTSLHLGPKNLPGTQPAVNQTSTLHQGPKNLPGTQPAVNQTTTLHLGPKNLPEIQPAVNQTSTLHLGTKNLPGTQPTVNQTSALHLGPRSLPNKSLNEGNVIHHQAQNNEYRQPNSNLKVQSPTVEECSSNQEPQLVIDENSQSNEGFEIRNDFYDNVPTNQLPQLLNLNGEFNKDSSDNSYNQQISSKHNTQNYQENNSILKGMINNKTFKIKTEEPVKNSPKRVMSFNNHYKEIPTASRVSDNFNNSERRVEIPPSVERNAPWLANETSNSCVDQPNAKSNGDINLPVKETPSQLITDLFKKLSNLEHNQTIDLANNKVFQDMKRALKDLRLINTTQVTKALESKLTSVDPADQEFRRLVNQFLSTDLCTESAQSRPMNQSTSGQGNSKVNTQVTAESSAVVGVLRCQLCLRWMASESVHCCKCAIICTECAAKARSCVNCGLDREHDIRVTALHERLSAVIPRPCINKQCPQLVVPGDTHESTCKYAPIPCPLCGNSIPGVNLRPHFVSVHPSQVLLKDMNTNVLRSQFFETSDNSSPMILCYTHNQCIWITIMKVENQENTEFIINRTHGDDDVNFTAKLEFKYNEYSHIAVPNVKKQAITTISVRKSVVNEWTSGLTTLDISFSVKKKRKSTNADEKRKKKMKKGVNGNETSL